MYRAQQQVQGVVTIFVFGVCNVVRAQEAIVQEERYSKEPIGEALDHVGTQAGNPGSRSCRDRGGTYHQGWEVQQHHHAIPSSRV